MYKGCKKVISIALAALSALGLFACSPKNDGDNDSNSSAPHRDEVGAVVKKGVSVSRYNDGKSASANKIKDLDAGWYYTWGPSTNNLYIDEYAEFVPMVHGKAHVTPAVLSEIKEKYEDGAYTHLLTFNEPDLPDQANMTVEEALSYWNDLEEIGIPLSSPAVSYYDKTDGNAWLDEFMEKADERGYRVDFIAVHIYQSFYSANAVTDLRDTLTALYDKYGLPVWLTEFGAIDIISRDSQHVPPGQKGTVSPSCTEQNAQKYITQATNMLETCGFVERYSWFVDNFAGLYGDARPWEAPYTTLYNDDDSISGVGQMYKGVASNYPLQLETTTLPKAQLNKNYRQQILVAGGTGDYRFTATGLPAGLKCYANGVISGTPTTKGSYPVKVTVTDSGAIGRKQTRTHRFVLQITN